MRRLFAFLVVVALLAGSARAVTGDPLSRVTRWSVAESWNRGQLVYTFYPEGLFRSSYWDAGRGQGTWSRDGRQLTMQWPKYGAYYRATVRDEEIRGTAYSADGRTMGTFVFRLMH